MVAVLRETVYVDGENSEVCFLLVMDVVSPTDVLCVVLYDSSSVLLCFHTCMVPARCRSYSRYYEESPVELPRPALANSLGSSSCLVVGLASMFNISLICSMVPVSS